MLGIVGNPSRSAGESPRAGVLPPSRFGAGRGVTVGVLVEALHRERQRPLDEDRQHRGAVVAGRAHVGDRARLRGDAGDDLLL